MKTNRNAVKPAVGHVVVIEDDKRKRVKWKMSIIKQVSVRQIVRAVRVRFGKNQNKHLVQHLYQLEL